MSSLVLNFVARAVYLQAFQINRDEEKLAKLLSLILMTQV
jgi:hypothetical protein